MKKVLNAKSITAIVGVAIFIIVGVFFFALENKDTTATTDNSVSTEQTVG